jgi:hypothetical protein
LNKFTGKEDATFDDVKNKIIITMVQTRVNKFVEENDIDVEETNKQIEGISGQIEAKRNEWAKELDAQREAWLEEQDAKTKAWMIQMPVRSWKRLKISPRRVGKPCSSVRRYHCAPGLQNYDVANSPILVEPNP